MMAMLTIVTSALVLSTAVGSPVADWVQRAMSAADLECASHSTRKWTVRDDTQGVIRVVSSEDQPELFHRRAPGGFFVGIDRGEWGGGAWWLGDDGQASHLTAANVRSIVVGAEDVWMLTDVERSAIRRGVVHRAQQRGPSWWLRRVAVLGTRGLQAMEDGAGALLVLTTDGLHRVTRSGEADRLFEGSFGTLHPNSMTKDERGHVFIGMRHVVVELVPAQPLWKARWLVPKDCVRFETIGDEFRCECQGPSPP